MSGEERAALRARVRAVLQRLSEQEPGHAVELRVPPHAAVQLIDGPRHTRGTPSAVVELDADTLFALVDGSLAWDAGVRAGRIHASGDRSDLRRLFPLAD